MTPKLTGEGGDAEAVKKKHCNFRLETVLLSLDMKTKIVQHVERD